MPTRKTTQASRRASLPRPRDRYATRASILEAARQAFTARGYDHVGVREIAAVVGVNAALVNRYFGSKEQLFAEAVPSTFDSRALLGGAHADLARRFARALLVKPRGAKYDPTLAVVRSVGSDVAGPLLRDGLSHHFIRPLADAIGGAHAEERAALVAATLFGVAITRDVLRVGPLASSNVDWLEEVLTQALTLFVTTAAAPARRRGAAKKRARPTSVA